LDAAQSSTQSGIALRRWRQQRGKSDAHRLLLLLLFIIIIIIIIIIDCRVFVVFCFLVFTFALEQIAKSSTVLHRAKAGGRMEPFVASDPRRVPACTVAARSPLAPAPGES
jgi:hypothetical protein